MDWNLTNLLWVALTVLGGYGFLWAVEHFWAPAFLRAEFSAREQRLVERVAELESTVEVLIETLHRQRAEIAALRLQLQEAHVLEQPPPAYRHVLGLWPNAYPALNQSGEKLAIYNAGMNYTALEGNACNRGGVVREIARLHPDIIEIGAHGNAGGIILSDGLAAPGWWGRLAQQYNVKLFVLLSCESSRQDVVNVSDALIRAGVPAVISSDNSLSDKEAVKFAQALYERLAEGLPLPQSVAIAKLVVNDAAAEMIRLRER